MTRSRADLQAFVLVFLRRINLVWAVRLVWVVSITIYAYRSLDTSASRTSWLAMLGRFPPGAVDEDDGPCAFGMRHSLLLRHASCEQQDGGRGRRNDDVRDSLIVVF